MSESARRRELIEEFVKQDGACKISDLAAKLNVTTMTIRRDLDLLGKKGSVRVYRGVAVPAKAPGYQVLEAESVMQDEKSRIAAAAASMVGAGETIIIDAGSTASMTAHELPRGVAMTAICISLNSLLNVIDNPDIEAILVGGVYHESSRIFESPEGIALLSRHRATKAFISTSGFREDMGVTCSNQFEIEVKKAALSSSVEKILIADSSKFGRVNSCFFAELREFDKLITDEGLPKEVQRSIHDLGIEVVAV